MKRGMAFWICTLGFFFGLTARADGPLKVVTSSTDLAWAAKEIGGELVDVHSLTQGTENLHFVDTIPDFIRWVADAQVVCVIGLDLEVGWMPKVLARSGNARVQPGGLGYCETGTGISPLQKPTGPVDRSMGDIHPSGNPHFWMGPKYFASAAGVIKDTLAKNDPPHAATYEKNYDRLKTKLDALQQKGKAKLSALLTTVKGPAVIEYHREFSYLFDAYGLTSLGSIEEKPGIPPSAGRIAEVSLAAKQAGVRLALAGEYVSKSTLRRFSELSGIPVVQVPVNVQPSGKFKDYYSLHEEWVAILAKAFETKPVKP